MELNFLCKIHKKFNFENTNFESNKMTTWQRLLLRPGHLKSAYGRSGKGFPVGGRLIVRRQLLLWWWLNSPWAPGHICGVSVMLMVVVVLLFSVLVQGLTKVSDQSRALEDRNDSDNSLEVYTPNSFILLFYNSPYMDVVDMHNILDYPKWFCPLGEDNGSLLSCRILPLSV